MEFRIDEATPFFFRHGLSTITTLGGNSLRFGRVNPANPNLFAALLVERVAPDESGLQSIEGTLEPGLYRLEIRTNLSVSQSTAKDAKGLAVDQRWHYLLNIDATGAPPPPALSELSLSTPTAAGCKSVQGQVTLSAPAPEGGTPVVIADTLSSATAPELVTVPAGSSTKTFTVKTVPVDSLENGSLSATLAGTTLTQALSVRPIGMLSAGLTPTSVVGGNAAVGKATLECKAGPGPITVDLSSSNAAVASPVAASIVVPQGLQSANFNVTTNAVQTKSYATISGTANGITKSKKLTVNVAASVSPTRLGFGNVTVGTTSAPLNATLTNRGAVPFSVIGISLTGTGAAWFGQSNNCPANLAAGASCTISVTFTPQAAASKSAKLSIATSATAAPLSVSLSGTGI